MIRKLILPAVAVLLLAGCATGYTYRSAPGDYYHGQAGVIYRDYYGYPGYRSYYSPYNWGGYYGYGSGYRFRYGYGYPYWGHGYQRPRPGDGHHGGGDHTPDRSNPPWRDLGRLQDRRETTTHAAPRSRPGQRPQAQRPPAIQRPAPTRRPSAPVNSGGSRMSELIRRARSD
jgi:hypothetical protein